MLEETNKLAVAVALLRAAVLSERWADAELALLDAEKQIAMLHGGIADKHFEAIRAAEKDQ